MLPKKTNSNSIINKFSIEKKKIHIYSRKTHLAKRYWMRIRRQWRWQHHIYIYSHRRIHNRIYSRRHINSILSPSFWQKQTNSQTQAVTKWNEMKWKDEVTVWFIRFYFNEKKDTPKRTNWWIVLNVMRFLFVCLFYILSFNHSRCLSK